MTDVFFFLVCLHVGAGEMHLRLESRLAMRIAANVLSQRRSRSTFFYK